MNNDDASYYKELIRLIAFTWLRIRQMGQRVLSELDYDLTFEQIMVLYMLEEEDGLQVGVLAERADRERTTMSRMVDGLEKRNLVVRIPDKHDKRQKLVYLTKLGKTRNEQMTQLVLRFVDEISKGLKREQTDVTYETLRTILANVEKR